MGFRDLPEQDAIRLLQRSLERGRLGHAYLFSGDDLAELERIARTLAKVVNCENPTRQAADSPSPLNGERAGVRGEAVPEGVVLSRVDSERTLPLPVDSCDQCVSCRRIDAANHPDISWVRPESKSRVIIIEQMRELMQTIHLKPTVARYKFGIVVAADRLNPQAANAFLKTLEEPPADSILVLLSTDPQRMLETIL